MPYMNIKGKNLYYEVYGEGAPVILLNGIMMSTLSWRPFIDAFEGYKLILVDLIDQGKSDKADKKYTQDMHVEMLKELFEGLGQPEVNRVGISYGGEVALEFALKYGDMLASLILSNTTAATNNIMRDIEEAWDYAAGTHDGGIFFKATMPYIYSSKFYNEKTEWLKKREETLKETLTPEWYEGFRRASRSASQHNVLDSLDKINVPTLIIGSELDVITPIRYQEELYHGIRNARMVVIKDAGHASMYEKPYEFAMAVLGFLKVYNKDINIV